jgi:hypothetical protein
MAKGKWQRANAKCFLGAFEICHLPFEILFSNYGGK